MFTGLKKLIWLNYLTKKESYTRLLEDTVERHRNTSYP